MKNLETPGKTGRVGRYAFCERVDEVNSAVMEASGSYLVLILMVLRT